ncbi:hypothetical protein TNIN_463121 [Trichonephila inaurata madagascariensis]|uniref:Uncharacterized protein n=1 Tax=Trichonephila inaurata madagascariensis TaxID=2747483 RepID=A0A8X7BQ67_9ARAC|nr:hypothetical protein TNIN_463121 [Trichonephila inaurata madagascariensis]
MSNSKFFHKTIDVYTLVCINNIIYLSSSKEHQRSSWIQESVSKIGALTTDIDKHGTTHGGQPGTSRTLP